MKQFLRKLGLSGINRLFLLVVALPTLLSVIYFGFIASDVYISEARFVVRSPERQAATPLGLLLKGAGFARADDDTYSVHDFILSRDALAVLDKELDLGNTYQSSSVDFLSRFGSLGGDTNFEELYKYYQKKVDVQYDTASSITTLVVRAFNADDALATNRKLLDMSEALVNRLNERARADMIRFASTEVKQAEITAKEAALTLSAYRNQKGVVDPEKQAAFQLQQVGKLQEELIATRAQLEQLKAFTPENPQLPVLVKRVKTLETLIADETGKVTGGTQSLAGRAAEYQRLALDREFAERQLASALASLEVARNDAQRQQLYLERIVHPGKPAAPMEPRRLRAILITIAFCMIFYGVLSLLLVSVREHVE